VRTREQLHEARRKIRREHRPSSEEKLLRGWLRVVESSTSVSAERAESRAAATRDSAWVYTVAKTALLSDVEWQKTWRTLPDPVLASRQTTQWASNARLSVLCCTDAVEAILGRYGTWRERVSTDDDSFFVFAPPSPREQQRTLAMRESMATQAFGYAFGSANGMYRQPTPTYGRVRPGESRGWCEKAGALKVSTQPNEPENPAYGDIWSPRGAEQTYIFADDEWLAIDRPPASAAL